MNYQTIFCINHPNKKAIIWCGHVHKNKTMIDSGLCNDCIQKADTGSHRKNQKKVCRKTSVYYNGCDGYWKRAFGIEKYE